MTDFEKVNINSGRLIVHNTIFKAPSLKPDPNIIITNSPDFHFRNVTLLCSGNVHYHHYQRPDANYSDGKTDKYIFACSSVCGQNEYKILNSGHQSTIVNAMTSSSISMTPVNPKCLPYPLGATCSYPFYFAKPDYWGYIRTDGRIQMIKCIEEYCCSGKENCQTIQSCNINSLSEVYEELIAMGKEII